MHILFATTDFVENDGPTTGLPKYLLRTSQTLVKWGHDVTVVTCSNRTVEYEFRGIEVHRVRTYSIKTYSNQYLDEMAICLRNAKIIHDEIVKILKKKKIDIIQYTSLSGLAYFHDNQTPSVVRLSSYAKMWPIKGMEECSRARSEIELAAAKKCDGVFGPSYIVADEFAKDLKRSVDVIETPFVLEIETTDYSLYRNYFEGKRYILFYGSLFEYKGLGVIASSIYEILNENKDIFFAIIGDGDREWSTLIKNNADLYSDRVISLPAIGFERLLPIIKNAELIVLPSLMENFSNACVESMALGQIVLGTNGASFEQLITDGVNGLLCEIGDKNSFINKIKEALSYDNEKKIDMKNKARRRAEDLEPEKVTKGLLEYYKKIIEKKS